jgi:hypothetical protein
MPNTVVRVYSDFSDAQHARDALLSSGFDEADVHLSSEEGEAGPPQGNFILDYKDTGTNFDSRKDAMLDREVRTDALRMEPNAMERGTFLLTVDAEDENASERASEIMGRFHAIDIDKRTKASNSE